MESNHRHEVLQFDGFRLDCAARVLYRNGQPISLTAKTVEALIALARQPGRVVTREELTQTLWPGRTVDPANLPQHISLLRKALAADGGVEFIRTFPNRGYEFLRQVEAVAEPEPEAAASRPRWRMPAIAAAALVAAIALVWGFAGIGERKLPAEWKRAPWVRLPGAKYLPALAPDGQKAAFAGTATGSEERCIFVARPGQASVEQIPGTCGEASSPVWSPDGSQLALVRFEYGRPAVTIHDFVTGKERELARLDITPSLWMHRVIAWSPDGKWLVVSDREPGEKPTIVLHLISADGRVRRQLTKGISERVIVDVEPSFSPDGRRVAFIRMISHLWRDVMVVDVESGESRNVAPRNRMIGGLDWSSDGKDVVFSARRDRDFRLWMVSANEPEGRVRAHPSGLYADSPIQFSARNGRLIYTVFTQDLNIRRLSLPSLEWREWLDSTGEDSAPQVSPDGRSVLFVSDRSGEEQLWMAGIDGTNPKQLTAGKLQPAIGRWSPDGKSVVFNAIDPTTHILDVAAGAIRQVPVNPRISLCEFSPDGRFLLGTVTLNTQQSLVRVPVSGGTVEPVQNIAAFFVRHSPGHQWLYFVRDRSGTDLWRMPAGGGKPEKFWPSQRVAGFGFWTVGREHVYNLSRHPDQPGWWIARKNIASGEVEYLARQGGELPPEGAGFLSLAPDESHLWSVWGDRGNSDLLEVSPSR